MSRFSLFALPLAVLAVGVFATGCDAFKPDADESDLSDDSGIVTLAGQVLDDANAPVAGAFIRVEPFGLLYEADAEGRYNFEVAVDSTMELELTISKDGFFSSLVTVLALAERTVAVPTVKLAPQASNQTRTSGFGKAIVLKSQTTSQIGVRESGSEEVLQLTFQVVDSLGRPVNLDHQAQVAFSLGANPGGEAQLTPAMATTDGNGEVTVTLASGTRAGTVQVVAEATALGRSFRSQPVAIAIHGGLPAQTHFSIAPNRVNFAGLRFLALKNAMTVVVGDKYANPVRQQTAVYFTSTHGVVEGSTLTDAQGLGVVQLISANPVPDDGIALVTATTSDERQQTISVETPVVFSGGSVLTVSPGTLDLNQRYTVTLTDQNGNPLVEGTTLSVTADGTNVKAVGNTNVTLDDTGFSGGVAYEHVVRGAGITEFAFMVVQDATDADAEAPVLNLITLTLSSDNGDIELVLGGLGNIQAGPEVRLLPAANGAIQARRD